MIIKSYSMDPAIDALVKRWAKRAGISESRAVRRMLLEALRTDKSMRRILRIGQIGSKSD